MHYHENLAYKYANDSSSHMNRALEKFMGIMGNGNREWEEKKKLGNGNREWEEKKRIQGMGIGNGKLEKSFPQDTSVKILRFS